MIRKFGFTLLALLVVGVVFVLGFTQYHKSPELFEPSVLGLYQTERPDLDPDSARTIAAGQIIGVRDAYNTQAWVGIPYAAEPIGSLRWKAPRPTEPWEGVFAANQMGDPCVQFWGSLAGVDGEPGQVVGSEDCLTLNVWAPEATVAETEAPQARYPVMVWIHGGSNDSGTANLYQAHHLAGAQKVVVVGVNYRLGMFGWLSHDALRATADSPEDASGNFGTLDLIQALRWVQTNIEQFGGDPSNVTIFGESAGGRNVYSLLASPLAKGLFHRAIAQSGSTDTTKLSLAENFADQRTTEREAGLRNSSNELFTAVLAKEFPADDEATLRQRLADMPADELLKLLRDHSAADLMQVAAANYGRPATLGMANVLRDGYVLPRESIQTLLQDPSRYNAVPLLTGTNRDENKLYMYRDPQYVDMQLGFVPKIKDRALYQRVSQIVSDNWKAGAVDEPAIALNQNAQPVYAYRFEWDDMPPNLLANLAELLGAAHGFEISYVFGDFIGGTPTEPLEGRGNLPRREALSLSMMDYWAEFAYNGDPGRGRSGTQPLWSAWSDMGNNLMILDEALSGGVRMGEVRTRFADIKHRLKNDDLISDLESRCRGYANLFLHGYQTDDFFDEQEYLAWGCADFPAGMFRTD